MHRPMRTRRLKKADFEADFFFIGVQTEWCFSLKRPGRFNKFFFSRSLISLRLKTRMSFLLESVKVCQLYFCFCLQNRFGLAKCVGGLPEIVHRSVTASAAKIDGFVIRVVPGAEETFARGELPFVTLRRAKYIRQSDGVGP